MILGNARGRIVEPACLRQLFRLRQLTRQVRRHGQIRPHNFGLYVDWRLSRQTVEVLIYANAVRIEQAEQLLASYRCVCDASVVRAGLYTLGNFDLGRQMWK